MHNKSHPVFFSSIYRMAFTVLPCALDDTSAFFVLFSYLILFFSFGNYLRFWWSVPSFHELWGNSLCFRWSRLLVAYFFLFRSFLLLILF